MTVYNPDTADNLIIREPQNRLILDVPATIEAWLAKRIKPSSPRARDIRNDKGKAVADFFDWCDKSPETVLPTDVLDWYELLQKEKLAHGTIYNRLSALTNYYEYLRLDAGLNRIIPINPARVTLPRPPKAYESKSVKALTPDQLFRLLAVVEEYAATGEVLYLRDHAILQFYAVTGRRREEIITLTGAHIEPRDDGILIRQKVKGGFYASFELMDQTALDALLTYLEATGRSASIFSMPIPLWLRHDKGAARLQFPAMTSHGFAKRMKIYAAEAGIADFHIHKLRHTYASIVAEKYESITDAQEALGHADSRTTRVYVQRLKVTKDKFSGSIRDALKNRGKK